MYPYSWFMSDRAKAIMIGAAFISGVGLLLHYALGFAMGVYP